MSDVETSSGSIDVEDDKTGGSFVAEDSAACRRCSAWSATTLSKVRERTKMVAKKASHDGRMASRVEVLMAIVGRNVAPDLVTK